MGKMKTEIAPKIPKSRILRLTEYSSVFDSNIRPAASLEKGERLLKTTIGAASFWLPNLQHLKGAQLEMEGDLQCPQLRSFWSLFISLFSVVADTNPRWYLLIFSIRQSLLPTAGCIL